MGIIVIVLFVLQLISFAVITLLFMKVSKFNNLERKQQQLMQEMDQSVTAYLNEIKEENDRFIRQLKMTNVPKTATSPIVEKQEKKVQLEPKRESKSEQEPFQPKVQPVPMHFALRSYQKTSASQQETEPMNDRQKIKQLYEDGKTVQQIAKELGKGKTEIELILKFS